MPDNRAPPARRTSASTKPRQPDIRCRPSARRRRLNKIPTTIAPTTGLALALNQSTSFSSTSKSRPACVLSGFGNERFHIRDAARQRAGQPLRAFRRNQHVVFDAHADAFIFFEGRTDRGDKLFVLRRLRQIVQRVETNVDRK